MSADSFDSFKYKPSNEHTLKAQRKHYWAVAIGLQDVNGLKVSNYLWNQAHAYIAGEKQLTEVGQLVREYHAGNNHESAGTKEANLVSQRIAELLARAAFALSPDMLATIHAYLFISAMRWCGHNTATCQSKYSLMTGSLPRSTKTSSAKTAAK